MMKKLYSLLLAGVFGFQVMAGVQTTVFELSQRPLSFSDSVVVPAFNTNLGTFVTGEYALQFDSAYYVTCTNRSRTYGTFTFNISMIPMLNSVETTNVIYNNSFGLPSWGSTNFVLYNTLYQTETCGPNESTVTYGLRPWTVCTAPGNSTVNTHADASGYLVVTYEYECFGVGSQGFWKNHPEAWPVEELEVAGNLKTKEQWIEVLEMAIHGDKFLIALKQLLAAKLNIITCDDACVNTEIAAVEAWLLLEDTSGWSEIEGAVNTLEQYNNGNMCRPHR